MKLITNVNGCKLITYKNGQVIVQKDGSRIGMFGSLKSAAEFALSFRGQMTTLAEYKANR